MFRVRSFCRNKLGSKNVSKKESPAATSSLLFSRQHVQRRSIVRRSTRTRNARSTSDSNNENASLIKSLPNGTPEGECPILEGPIVPFHPISPSLLSYMIDDTVSDNANLTIHASINSNQDPEPFSSSQVRGHPFDFHCESPFHELCTVDDDDVTDSINKDCQQLSPVVTRLPLWISNTLKFCTIESSTAKHPIGNVGCSAPGEFRGTEDETSPNADELLAIEDGRLSSCSIRPHHSNKSARPRTISLRTRLHKKKFKIDSTIHPECPVTPPSAVRREEKPVVDGGRETVKMERTQTTKVMNQNPPTVHAPEYPAEMAEELEVRLRNRIASLMPKIKESKESNGDVAEQRIMDMLDRLLGSVNKKSIEKVTSDARRFERVLLSYAIVAQL